MDGIQGAVLSVKLKYLEEWNSARRKNARLYSRLLGSMKKITVPVESDYAKHVYHIYSIRVDNRDELIKSLAQKNIFCGIHYPVPLHLQDAYKSLGYGKGSFPVAEKCAEQIVSLPMFAELTSEQIETVSNEIKSLIGD